MGRGRKIQQSQGRPRGEAQRGASPQTRERTIARRGRGIRPRKETPTKGGREKIRWEAQARGPRCHRCCCERCGRWARCVCGKLKQEWRRAPGGRELRRHRDRQRARSVGSGHRQVGRRQHRESGGHHCRETPRGARSHVLASWPLYLTFWTHCSPQRRYKVLFRSFSISYGFLTCLVKAAFNAYVDRELPNIRAEVPSPLRPAGSALTIVMFAATRITPATVQGAECLLSQSTNAIHAAFQPSTGFALQAIP